jgi:hypothetical protein
MISAIDIKQIGKFRKDIQDHIISFQKNNKDIIKKKNDEIVPKFLMIKHKETSESIIPINTRPDVIIHNIARYFPYKSAYWLIYVPHGIVTSKQIKQQFKKHKNFRISINETFTLVGLHQIHKCVITSKRGGHIRISSICNILGNLLEHVAITACLQEEGDKKGSFKQTKKNKHLNKCNNATCAPINLTFFKNFLKENFKNTYLAISGLYIHKKLELQTREDKKLEIQAEEDKLGKKIKLESSSEQRKSVISTISVSSLLPEYYSFAFIDKVHHLDICLLDSFGLIIFEQKVLRSELETKWEDICIYLKKVYSSTQCIKLVIPDLFLMESNFGKIPSFVQIVEVVPGCQNMRYLEALMSYTGNCIGYFPLLQTSNKCTNYLYQMTFLL